RSLDVRSRQFVSRQVKHGGHVNWCYGSDGGRTSVRIRGSARREDADAGGRGGECTEPDGQKGAESGALGHYAARNAGVGRGATDPRCAGSESSRKAGEKFAG